MNEIKLFSLRRTVFLSLLLGLFAMIIIGQVTGTGDNGDDTEPGSMNVSSTTTTTNASTTSSTSGQNVTMETQVSTTYQQTAADKNNAEFDQIRDQEFTQEDSASLGIEFDNVFRSFFEFSISYLVTSMIFFGGIATFYVLIFNSTELREYVNQSLTQAGFQDKISPFKKRWIIGGEGKNFKMSLIGLRSLRMKIELPKQDNVDPREFGLRRLENSAVTYCDLDVLPLRLQVVKLYLTEFE